MERHPIAYLPVEFGSREFDSKALLAIVLATRGYAVVIGQQWLLVQNLAQLPAGAVLFKSFNSIQQSAMRAAKSAGHFVATLEEELLSHMERKLIASACVGDLFSLPDVIFTNSEFERDVLTELSGGRTKIEVAGNGRVDVLKPQHHAYFQRDIDAVRSKFGDFVLVNTNFGVTNTIWNTLEQVTEIQIRAGNLNPNDPESMAAWQEQIAFEHDNKAAIVAAIKELCRRRPGQRIVVRPHPGEALERWNGVFDGLPNVSIVREGAHVPWTLACKLLLHTSCTTGFEAHVAGKTALSLVPRPDFISNSFISNHLNPVFYTPVDLVDAAEVCLDGREPAVRGRMDLAESSYYVWNIGERRGVERTADLLTRDGLPPPGSKVTLPALQHIERSETLKAKFSLSPTQCVDVFQRILNVTGRRETMNLSQIGDSLFQVAPI